MVNSWAISNLMRVLRNSLTASIFSSSVFSYRTSRALAVRMLYRRPNRYFNGHGLLLSFSSVGVFSWEKNRITDQELLELMKEFMVTENIHGKLSNDCSNNDCNNTDSDSIANSAEKSMDHNKESSTINTTFKETSFMVVNCLESTQKSQENWEEVINKPHFHVWRKSIDNTSLYEYKVFGSFFDISAYSFYAVQRDLLYRKEWDKLVIKLDTIDKEPEYMNDKNGKVDDSGNELIHWIMKYPYPMKNREYIYIRRLKVDYDQQFIVIFNKGVPYDDIPECPEHVRVYDYMSQMVIRPHQNDFHCHGFDYMLNYFDDARASFPSPAYKWMTSYAVPNFVEKLHQAALSLGILGIRHWNTE